MSFDPWLCSFMLSQALRPVLIKRQQVKLQFSLGLICSNLSSSKSVKTQIIIFEAKWKLVRPHFPLCVNQFLWRLSGPVQAQMKKRGFLHLSFLGRCEEWGAFLDTESLNLLTSVQSTLCIKWAVNILRTSGGVCQVWRGETSSPWKALNRGHFPTCHCPLPA